MMTNEIVKSEANCDEKVYNNDYRMVSAVVASLLQSYLGKYLELSDTTISVGSEIRAIDVRIRESAFTDLLVNLFYFTPL